VLELVLLLLWQLHGFRAKVELLLELVLELVLELLLLLALDHLLELLLELVLLLALDHLRSVRLHRFQPAMYPRIYSRIYIWMLDKLRIHISDISRAICDEHLSSICAQAYHTSVAYVHKHISNCCA
jgi:hypothetical protein